MAEAAARSGGGLLLYCVRACDGAEAPPLSAGARGVLGAELRWIVAGDLAALASPVEDPAAIAAPAAAELLLYQRVIQQQHAAADVLPMRFGGVLAGDDAVRAHLDAQREAHRRQLDRVAGCTEMGLRALVDSLPPEQEIPEPTGRGPGAAYLRARQRHHAAEDGVRRRCEDLLNREIIPLIAPLCREHRCEPPPPRSGAPAICSAYFLVPRANVSAFRAALSPLVQDGNRQLMISGPWPPYSFV